MKLLKIIYNEAPDLFNYYQLLLKMKVEKYLILHLMDNTSVAQKMGFQKNLLTITTLLEKLLKNLYEPKIVNSYPKIISENNEYELLNLHFIQKNKKVSTKNEEES